jgi:hypothetical protein
MIDTSLVSFWRQGEYDDLRVSISNYPEDLEQSFKTASYEARGWATDSAVGIKTVG